MRVALAVAIYCLAAGTAADAHDGPRHPRHTLSPAAMLAPGLVHMLESARKPRAWCGWYMRKVEHVADPAYDRAAYWVHYGRRAAGPAPGIIVVWPHHVGVIRGGPDGAGHWLIESGNDGNAVRRRFRSLAGAIALRAPAGRP